MNDPIIIGGIVTLVSNLMTYFFTSKYKRQKEDFEIRKETSDYYIETNRDLLKEIGDKTKQIIELNGRVIYLERENENLKNQVANLQVICESNSKTIEDLKKVIESKK